MCHVCLAKHVVVWLMHTWNCCIPQGSSTSPWQVKCIDIESLQNRLLKVCYVPTTSAGLPRLSFFSFYAAAINSTDEANKVGSTCH